MVLENLQWKFLTTGGFKTTTKTTGGFGRGSKTTGGNDVESISTSGFDGGFKTTAKTTTLKIFREAYLSMKYKYAL